MDTFHTSLWRSSCVSLVVLYLAHAHVYMQEHYRCGVEDNVVSGEVSKRRVARATQSNSAIVAEHWKVIELSIVCDKACYDRMIERGKEPETFLYDTVKEASKRMISVSTTITLVQMEVWSTHDLINITREANDLIELIRVYRKDVLLPKVWSDATFLITGSELDHTGGEIDGLFGVASVCLFSGAGLLSYASQSDNRFAQFVVHELGHALGSSHDTSACYCQYGTGNCVMAGTMNDVQVTYSAWSTCSIDYYAVNLGYENTACLYNTPETAYVPEGSSACGNGVVDDGEECDCGNSCINDCCQCCNSRCQLMSSAQCAMGECCDISGGLCRFREAGVVCRESQHETCDQAEMCTGNGEECPADDIAVDGTSCSSELGEESYCLTGRCLTRDSQCQQYWDTDYSSSDDECYAYSVRGGSRYANCGEISEPETVYIQCNDTGNPYYTCGTLQCQGPASDNLVIASSYYRYPLQNPWITSSICRILGYSDWEYPLQGRMYVADGTKCGENKACLNMDCLDKEVVFAALAEPEPEPEPVCGDGIVAGDEQCDCGASMQSCGCCDPVTCRYILRDVACLDNECGRCHGRKAECTRRMPNLTPCENNVGQCYKGVCVSVTQACHRYFDENAVAATDVMVYNSQYNASQWNGGGFILKHMDGGGWASQAELTRADGDGQCGILLCNATVPAHVPYGDSGVDYPTTTFYLQPDIFRATKCGYYQIEVIRNRETQYKKYIPILVDNGSPCSVDGHRGYCSTNNIQMDALDWTWYMKAKCVVP